MFLNVGGAVLGVAVLTVISDSVASNHGGKSNPEANLEGYRAGYYGALAMIAIGFILSLFFSQKEQQQEHSPRQEGEEKKGEEKKGERHESEGDKKAEKEESPVAITDMSTSATVSEEESEGKLNGREKMVGSTEEEDGAISSSNESERRRNKGASLYQNIQPPAMNY